MDYSGSGYLKVRVCTANGAIPIEGAVVLVFFDNANEGGFLIRSLRSDASGLCETITIPAPPKSLSLAPNPSQIPYSTVNVQTTGDNYYTVENVGIPIFDGETSVQTVNLIPMNGEANYPEEGRTVVESQRYAAIDYYTSKNAQE